MPGARQRHDQQGEGQGEGEALELVNSAAVEDFIGVVPPWLLRRGNSSLLLIFLAFVVGAWLFEYPDVVSAPVTITTQSPPAPVVAQTRGRLGELWVQDGELVEREQWLAVIDNAAKTEDLRTLAAMLEDFARELEAPEQFDATAHGLGATLELGDLQVEYAEFVATWGALRELLDDPYFGESDAALMAQLDTRTELASTIRTQRRGLSEDLDLARREAKATTRLAKDGVIPTDEVEAAGAAVRERERALEAAELELLRGKLERVSLDRNRVELGYTLRDRRRELVRELLDAYAALSRAYDRWRGDYLLVAPMAGRISLGQVWAEQQWVSEGDEVMTVLPDREVLVAHAILAQLNSGKVEVGQHVLIKLDGYPYREYGVVEGRVASVPAIARDGVYLVNIELPQGLFTTYQQTLELRHEMGGRAEIVTVERRLIEWLFLPIYSLLSDT
ncbi:HlyD family efflux transporter periplasmic adaptor subunit [Enhygromyxa salina]|nr:HlyD family efflux transporter periplasmic adaptor subunit [Enhygromyxa salina]